MIRKRELEFAHAQSPGGGGAYVGSELAHGPDVVLFDYDDTHLKTIIHPAGPVASGYHRSVKPGPRKRTW